MRKAFIAGNWKMNNTVEESIKLVEEIKEKLKEAKMENVEAAVCVPPTSLSDVVKTAKGSDLKVGAQNMHWEESGAYTGEVSPLMLNSLGVEYCIIGHSERRQYFNETDETVNKKIKSALKHDIKPIFCVGESLEQREKGIEEDIVKEQILKGLKDISDKDMEGITVAYEPIWAIGTGKTASSEEANNMCAFIRNTIEERYSKDISEKIIIQYGGSVKPENVSEIMSMSDIDGALVGGASLKADDFIKLTQF